MRVQDANGDLDRAIGNYEQDPNRYASDKYDETLFSQDRDGGSNQYAGIPCECSTRGSSRLRSGA